MNKVKKAITVFCILLLISGIAACGKKNNTDSSSKEETSTSSPEDKKGFFDASFTVDTAIGYSDGSDNNWAYGNQRKEFSADDDCYVRVGSKAITDKKKGVDEKIKVTYRFTGVDNCNVELTDGMSTELESQDPNVKEFEGTLYPKKKNKAQESIAVFKYDPSGEGSITLEVIYDDNVDSQYDKRNTVYFVKNKDETKEDKGAH